MGHAVGPNLLPCVIGLCVTLLSVLAHAEQTSSGSSAASAAHAASDGHGPHASYRTFPSHRFQLAPRWHDTPQLSVHAGLLQPILFSGFNAALDLRWGPMLFSYSHGQGLDYSAKPELGLTAEERDAGLQLQSPWTTGGGVGVVFLDEAWFMLDVKRHRYHAQVNDAEVDYSTTSIGAELGYRYFLWRGLFAQAVFRFWPNVSTTLPSDRVRLGQFEHKARDLGAFSNVMLGWAFDI